MNPLLRDIRHNPLLWLLAPDRGLLRSHDWRGPLGVFLLAFLSTLRSSWA
jgi:hypothetical protein